MPLVYDSLSDSLRDWALGQSLFFIASAPLTGRHINVSPKGLPEASLAVLDPNRIAYVDSTGSGCETICHLRENGRATVMFCSFARTPRIMRLYCTGAVIVEAHEPDFGAWLARMGSGKGLLGARAVIVLDIFKVQLSCGFGVPYIVDPAAAASADGEPTPSEDTRKFFQTRPRLAKFARYTIDHEGLAEYHKTWNMESLDGLPGLHSAWREGGRPIWRGQLTNWLRRNRYRLEMVQTGVMMVLLAYVIYGNWQRAGGAWNS